jgi:transcriptional regulator with XRE-family HTH domain
VNAYSPDHVALGRAIRRLRSALGLSQEQLADRIGLDRTYVGGIERGERNVSFEKVLRIGEGLEVSPQELIAKFERERAPVPD